MALSKPTRPEWATGDPGYIAEPSPAKRTLGWEFAEKPFFQWMNWLHNKVGEWLSHHEDYFDITHDLIIRSDTPLTWTGTQLIFANSIEIRYRIGGSVYVARIPSSASPIDLSANLRVIVVILPQATGNLSLGSYPISSGEYANTTEGTIQQNDNEREIILFRRRNFDLEIPILKQVVSADNGFTIFKPGEAFPRNDIGGLVPLGTIIPHYSYDGGQLLSYDTNSWLPCNGQSGITFGDGVTRTLPDLSNRYLVGLGTEGGNDIHTATWSAVPVGNANHVIDLQHDHNVDIAPFTSGDESAHTHPETNHVHPLSGNGWAYIGIRAADSAYDMAIFKSVPSFTCTHQRLTNNSPYIWLATGNTNTIATELGGATDSGGGGTTGVGTIHNHTVNPPGTDTDNALSISEDVQPRSIPVRFLIRYK